MSLQFSHANEAKREATRLRKREWARTHGQSRKYYAKNAEKVKASARDHYRKNATKHRASHSLLVKVYTGQIARPSACSSCGSKLHVEAHHADYSKPYDVIWLCRSCHKKLHAEVR